ncbi:unnamed protein product [Danaus chrysippus]|uniref:(African queen) hypothetical protein n=1 Tax=Danaus chrysippus TaxID=151541 RepID=A0A8J2R5W0_9NEOP|nr:unnamed protein product [Danaus chrysippus]
MSGSDSEEENTLRYGTPLEPYEEDEIPSKKKYQPQEQYALDEHGKRRFHGAFTGGFSAGFGNSVGTPEGWTPSSFKSSRADKAQFSSQRPEDFMDEEDRSEFGIAPRSLQANQEFTGQKRTRTRYYDGTIPGVPVLEQLLRPVHETTAVKILRKMGWKEGQGIGDRITKTEKKLANKQHKVYGCYMPDDMKQVNQESDSSESEFEYGQLFAPDDYEPYVLKNKHDKFGLGYEGLSRHSVLGNMVGEYDAGGSKSHLLMRDKGRKVSIRGQAFGVGAFEADDEDIYSREDMTNYDYEMGPEVTKKKDVAKQQNNVLQGFVKSKAKLPSIASYPPPTLPRGYVPTTRKSRFDESITPQRDQGLGRHELTAAARGALLGEKPLNSTENIQNKDTEQQNTANSTKILIKDMTIPQETQELNFISIKDTNKTNLKVFKPFSSDPQKQLRYERYLEMKPERDSANDRLSQWERDREMAEFEQAAKLYKPLTGIMGDRFTHASEPDEALNPLCAVAKSSINYGLATPEMIEAAKKGAYGVMTRKEVSWRPETLVCKRFNVPEIGGRLEESKDDKPKVSYSIFSYMETSVHDKESFTKEQTKFSGSKSLNSSNIENKTKKPDKDEEKQENVNNEKNPTKRLTVAELFIKESEKDLIEKDKEVAHTIEKFDKIDLYKSIFLSDSEDEGIDKNDSNDATKNIERNNSPPRGIFANIDFDELNAWRRNTNKQTDKETKQNQETNNKELTKDTNSDDKHEDKVNELMYGPKIPENLQKRLEVPQKDNFKPVYRSKDKRDESSSSSESWVEADKQKKQKKKKSKKQKSKHKKKHKKKDR